MRQVYADRLLKLSKMIDSREAPLGVGLKNQCWAGIAWEVASAHQARVTEYFGISFREMRDAIKGNNQCEPVRRNATMSARCRDLAASR